eukprot:m.181013 g.181013  ORF g.181013 m.181013 type:complete len:94 (+) comp14662_c1_seq6:2823-3104(+)
MQSKRLLQEQDKNMPFHTIEIGTFLAAPTCAVAFKCNSSANWLYGSVLARAHDVLYICAASLCNCTRACTFVDFVASFPNSGSSIDWFVTVIP